MSSLSVKFWHLKLLFYVYLLAYWVKILDITRNYTLSRESAICDEYLTINKAAKGAG